MTKRILVLSDSHGMGRVDGILMKAESMGKLDGVIHLGDGVRDLNPYLSQLENVYQVSGNCDFFAGDKELCVTQFGVPIFMTHGHLYSVKSGLYGLQSRARELHCKAALFGHTHEAHNEDVGGLLLLNPGAACDGHFAILKILDGGGLIAQMF